MADGAAVMGGLVEDRPWLKSYPPGVPAEIDPLPYSSLADFFDQSCKRHAQRTAYHSLGASMTFATLHQKATAIGSYLQSLGLQPGDRVGVMLPNILQNPVTLFGILKAGLIVVNINPLYTPRELEYQLKDSGAKAIVVLENFAHTLSEVIARTDLRHVIVASMGDMLGLKGHLVNLVVRRVKKLVPAWSLPGHVSFRRALAEGARRGLAPVAMKPQDVAFLQYTGGTTASPRARR